MKNILQVLFKGSSVSSPANWKLGQLAITILATSIVLIVNILSAMGYSLPVDNETANTIAAGVIAVINLVLTVVTTDKIGLKGKE